MNACAMYHFKALPQMKETNSFQTQLHRSSPSQYCPVSHQSCSIHFSLIQFSIIVWIYCHLVAYKQVRLVLLRKPTHCIKSSFLVLNMHKPVDRKTKAGILVMITVIAHKYTPLKPHFEVTGYICFPYSCLVLSLTVRGEAGN